MIHNKDTSRMQNSRANVLHICTKDTALNNNKITIYEYLKRICMHPKDDEKEKLHWNFNIIKSLTVNIFQLEVSLNLP